jgi:hypothetical protein
MFFSYGYNHKAYLLINLASNKMMISGGIIVDGIARFIQPDLDLKSDMKFNDVGCFEVGNWAKLHVRKYKMVKWL